MIRKRNSYPTFATESTNEKRERKMDNHNGSSGEEFSGVSRTENGRSADDDEMINVVDVSDSEERMDSSDSHHPNNDHAESKIVPGPSIIIESSTSISQLSTLTSAASLPLDLSKKKRRLTISTSLTDESDIKNDDGDYSDSEQERQRKNVAGFSGIRGGSFGAGGTTSLSSTIKWRRPALDCDIPSRGQSPAVIVAPVDHMLPVFQNQQISPIGRNASDALQNHLQTRPSVIKSSEFSFEPLESTDVDEHFRKSLSGNQLTTEADAKVDDHFARALGDVWWALKNRMHLTSSNDDSSVTLASPSPATFSYSTSNCVAVSNSNSAPIQSDVVTSVPNESPTKFNLTTTILSCTPLKKRILSKAAIEAAAQRLELNNAESAAHTNTNSGNAQDGYSDRINNNSNHSDEDSRKSFSAPNTPPPTPL